MDINFLKTYAERCRCLAENADEFTKRRLLDLAAKYDRRLPAAGPSAVMRILKAPLDLKNTPKHILGNGPQVRSFGFIRGEHVVAYLPLRGTLRLISNCNC